MVVEHDADWVRSITAHLDREDLGEVATVIDARLHASWYDRDAATGGVRSASAMTPSIC